MADQKPSPADILAKIRAAKAGAGGAAPPPETPAPAAAESAPAPAAAPSPPAAAPADKPKSPAEIMAAIRANKAAAGGAAPAAATPAAAAPAAKPAAAKLAAAAAAASGDRPSVQDMLKAVKQAEATPAAAAAVATAAAPAKPKLPAKGAPGKKDAAPVTRRSFPAAMLAAIAVPYYLAWTVLAAIGGVWSLAIARFMMPNTVLELPSRFKIGPPSDYPYGKVSEKFKPSRGVYIVNTEFDGAPAIYALSSVCTHLGCTPSWLEAEQKFKCPCHGSGFYITGVNFEGPAPRPLERVGLSLSPDGQLEVDKSVKFQDELGQWQDPKSFVRIA